MAPLLRRPILYYTLGALWVVWNGLPWHHWHWAAVDWMLISGYVALLTTIAFASSSRRRIEHTLDRLEQRKILIRGPDTQDLKPGLDNRARKFARIGAVFVALCIVGAFLPNIRTKWPLCLFETAWAIPAGLQLGRLFAYGTIGWYLRQSHVKLQAVPGHLDGAAGLRPVGDYCLYLAMVVAIPALYLALWSFAIPTFPLVRARYYYWMHPYLGLLAIAIAVEIVVFVTPMWRFHLDMLASKEYLLPEADSLSQEIVTIGARLAASLTKDERDTLNQELTIKTKQYWDIEKMPTWPLDIIIFRHFVIRNAALLLPLIAEASGMHEAWVKVLEKAVNPG